MVRLVVLISCALLLVSGGAFAADDEEAERTGVYRSITGNMAWNSDEDDQDREDFTGGLDVAIGFQLDKYGMGIFGSWLYDAQQLSFGVESKIFPLGIADTWLPESMKWDRVRPYISLGAGLMNAEYEKNGKDGHRWGGVLRFGLGVDVFVTNRLAVTGQVEYRPGTGGLHHINYVVGGVGLKLIGF